MSKEQLENLDHPDDHVLKILKDAERLLAHPKTRHEGLDLMRLASCYMQRQKNLMAYAALTSQRPNIPECEPEPFIKQLKG